MKHSRQDNGFELAISAVFKFSEYITLELNCDKDRCNKLAKIEVYHFLCVSNDEEVLCT